MGGVIPKPAQSSSTVGRDSKVSRKYRSNSEVPGRNVQGGGAVGTNIWKRDLGGDRGDYQGPDGIPPAGGAKDHGGDGTVRVRWRVGVSIGRGGDGRCEAPPHWSVHQEVTDNHSVEAGLPPRIYTVHRGIEDAGDDPDGALVGSIRGK